MIAGMVEIKEKLRQVCDEIRNLIMLPLAIYFYRYHLCQSFGNLSELGIVQVHLGFDSPHHSEEGDLTDDGFKKKPEKSKSC